MGARCYFAVKGYLSQPLVLTRGGWLASLAVVGAIAAVAFILSWSSTKDLAHEKVAQTNAKRELLRRQLSARIDANRRDTKRAQEQARIAKRLAKLERPTVARLLALLRAAKTSSQRAEVANAFLGVGLATPAFAPTARAPPEPKAQRPSAPHRPVTHHGAQPPSTPTQGPTPNPSPPAHEQPAVSVHTPPAVPIPPLCVPSILQVNGGCPRFLP